MTRDEIFKHFQRHEGVISHMYLDTVGKVTIGIGFMIPDPHSVLAYRLIHRETGVAATSAEKQADWTKVSQQSKGKLAGTYKRFTQLDMPENAVRRMLSAKLRAFSESLRTRFPEFDGFPPQARLALLDMIYNVGPNGLFKGFPKFCRAAERLDWEACAAECSRKGISPERNEDCRKLFLKALPPA
jgi:GH24 family phage-related lysozyme (muramidase)